MSRSSNIGRYAPDAVAKVDDISALPAVASGRRISVTGYHPSTTVGGGDFVGVAAARHDGVINFDPTRSAEIGTAAYYVDSGSNAPCWARTNVLEINLFQAGAKGDGTTDDYEPINKAKNLAKSLFIPIYVPEGIFAVSSTIVCDTGITWRGELMATSGTSSNTQLGKSILKSIGALTILEFGKSGEIIYNAEVSNISFDGNFIATRCLRARTIYESNFKHLRATKCAGAQAAFDIDDSYGNISLKVQLEDCHYNGTANALAVNSGGFKFSSLNASGGGVVQCKVRNCSALVQDGVGFYINGSDNNVIESFQGFVTGTGSGIRLAGGGVGTPYGRNNQFIVPVGTIFAETGTYGNQIFTASSEVLELTTQPNCQIHYEVFDYVESSIYKTHKYRITDYVDFDCSGLTVTGSAVSTNAAAGLWGATRFNDASNGGVVFNMPPNYHLKNGNLTAVEFVYTSDTANTSANCVFRVRAEVGVDGVAATTPDNDISITAAVNDAANRTNIHTEDISGTPINLTGADQKPIYFRVERLPLDVSDNAIGNIDLLTIRFYFEYDSPINGQSTGITKPFKDF